MTTTIHFQSVEEYITGSAAKAQGILGAIRQIIHAAAPDATESISYHVPLFKLNSKVLIYLAAWKTHIAIYPIPACTEALKNELAPYVSGKGTIRFGLNKPVPLELVSAIVGARVKQING